MHSEVGLSPVVSFSATSVSDNAAAVYNGLMPTIGRNLRTRISALMASMVAASGVVVATATAALAASPPSCVGDQVSNCGDTIYLHNGTVQHHPRVYLIFLGPN